MAHTQALRAPEICKEGIHQNNDYKENAYHQPRLAN
jgi:hypothetical protein